MIATTTRRALAGVAVLAASTTACTTERTPPPELPFHGALATRAYRMPAHRWHRVDVEHTPLRLWVTRMSGDEFHWQRWADSAARARADLVAFFADSSATTAAGRARVDSAADVFVLYSRDDMKRLTGRPLAGFVQPGEPTVFVVADTGFRPPLRHELAHLYSLRALGEPAAGDDAAWLVEGLGGWAGGACQGHTPDALAAGLLARGALPSAADLAARFRSLPEDVAVPAASSLVGYLIERDGLAGLRRRWAAPSAAGALPDSATEASWREQLARTSPAALDVARVMREGC